MAKLKDFISGLARKAGIETTDPFFAAIPDVDVPETVQTGIDNSLISFNDAKNNHPDIRKHYQSSLLAGVDQNITDLLEELQVEDAVKQEILAERSTYKRVPLLTKKLLELEKAKATANGSKDKQAIQKEIDDLHTAIAAEKTARAADKKAFDDQLLGIKINTKIAEKFGGFKTIHDELDPEVRNTVLSTLINKELQDKQAKFAFDENGNFTLLKSDGTNFYGENHQQIKPESFIEQTLAKTKQLKVNSGQPPKDQNNSGRRQPIDGNNDNKNTLVIDLNAQAMADYDKAMANAPGR